jgi:protein TonB
MSDDEEPVGRVWPSLIERAREKWGERAGRRVCGIAAALAIEALLLLALISLGEFKPLQKIVPLSLTSFDVKDEPPEPEPQPKSSTQAAAARPVAQPSPQPAQTVPQPQPRPAAIIPTQPAEVQSFDLSKIARAPAAPSKPGKLIGPVDTPRFGDSQRVGTAPNGQPMYAASWYPYEPTDEQMAGYLSTAEPGWALVTCKTVADYRVEDCVGLDEYPDNSRLIQAVLAAAWQFRIRPPRVNGVLQVGDWVRIRVTYEQKAAPSYGDAGAR